MAAHGRRRRRRGAGHPRRAAAADGRVGGRRHARALQGDLRPRGRPVPALRGGLAHPGAWAVGRQPNDILVPAMPALRRIGHKGADLIVPGNTPASFDAALATGVDMIEFDVLPERREDPDGPLVLAHDYDHVAGAPPLEAGLAPLASSAFAGLELDVDLKLPGYEARVVEALREHGLVERTLVSSNWMRSLVVLRALEPRLRLGWSVPRVRKDWTQNWLTKVPAYAALGYVRTRLPGAYARHHAA